MSVIVSLEFFPLISIINPVSGKNKKCEVIQDMQNCKQEPLVDIRDVLAAVEAEHCKSPEDKIVSFMQKIKSPYEYKVGSVTVKTSFAGNITMDDCFANFLATM